MRTMATLLLSICLAGTPLLIGCERTLSSQESTESSSNGTTVHKEDTVKQDANGNIVHDQTKTVDHP